MAEAAISLVYEYTLLECKRTISKKHTATGFLIQDKERSSLSVGLWACLTLLEIFVYVFSVGMEPNNPAL